MRSIKFEICQVKVENLRKISIPEAQTMKTLESGDNHLTHNEQTGTKKEQFTRARTFNKWEAVAIYDFREKYHLTIRLGREIRRRIGSDC